MALKPNARNWVGVTGVSQIEEDKKLKQQLLDENPLLLKRFSGIDDGEYALVKITKSKVEQFG